MSDQLHIVIWLMVIGLVSACTTSPITYSNEDLYTHVDNTMPSIAWADQVSIVNWNIQFGFADSLEVFDAGTVGGSHDHLDNLCEAIRSVDPTIVGLQEVAIGLDKSIVQDQAKYLAECLGMNYAIGQYSSYLNGREPFVRGKKCLTILTKYEIEDIANIEIFSNQPDDRRTVLVAHLLDADGRRFNVLNTHLSSKSTSVDIRHQFEACTSIYNDQHGASIFLGDFNVTYPSTLFDGLLQDDLFILASHAEQQCAYDFERALIDHILVDTSVFEIASHCLLDAEYWSLSDHDGVVGTIALKK